MTPMTTLPSWFTSGWCGANQPLSGVHGHPHGPLVAPAAQTWPATGVPGAADVPELALLELLLLLPHAATITANAANATTASRIFPVVISSPCSCLPPDAANTRVALATTPCALRAA